MDWRGSQLVSDVGGSLVGPSPEPVVSGARQAQDRAEISAAQLVSENCWVFGGQGEGTHVSCWNRVRELLKTTPLSDPSPEKPTDQSSPAKNLQGLEQNEHVGLVQASVQAERGAL